MIKIYMKCVHNVEKESACPVRMKVGHVSSRSTDFSWMIGTDYSLTYCMYQVCDRVFFTRCRKFLTALTFKVSFPDEILFVRISCVLFESLSNI